MFVQLSQIAKANLGYKSLQNAFFYVNQATIDTYGIEPKYLTPILMLRDIDVTSFYQKASPTLWLFNCKDKKSDLRGTGAIRYIEAMASRSATEKKQVLSRKQFKKHLRHKVADFGTLQRHGRAITAFGCARLSAPLSRRFSSLSPPLSINAVIV